MRTLRMATLTVIAVLVAALPARAAEQWQTRLAATWTDTGPSYDGLDDDGDPIHFNGGDSLGLSLGLERRFNDLLGLEVAIDASRPEARLMIDSAAYGPLSATDRLSLWTLRAGLNFHFLADGPIDVYIGPTIAWLYSPGVLSFKVHVESMTENLKIKSSNGFGLGGTVGADFDLGEGWAVGVSYTYLKADLDFSPEGETDKESLALDPSTLRLGVGIRF
jgi:outer membrane protein W